MILWLNNLTFSKKGQLSTLTLHYTRSKSIAFFVVALLFFGNVLGSELVIHKNGFSAAQKLGVLKVLKDQQAYYVLTNDGLSKVNRHDVDAPLKKMSDMQIVSFLNNGNGVIRVKGFNNGEFRLEKHVYGDGGGAIGAFAGIIIGKASVSFLGHGTILALSFLTGPAQPAALLAMESVAGPYIEAASVHAAAVCGIAGAALTGPV